MTIGFTSVGRHCGTLLVKWAGVGITLLPVEINFIDWISQAFNKLM